MKPLTELERQQKRTSCSYGFRLSLLFFFFFFFSLSHSSDLEGSRDGNKLCAFWPLGGCRDPVPSCAVRAPAAEARPEKQKWTQGGLGEPWSLGDEGGKGVPGAHGLLLLGVGTGL